MLYYIFDTVLSLYLILIQKLNHKENLKKNIIIHITLLFSLGPKLDTNF